MAITPRTSLEKQNSNNWIKKIKELKETITGNYISKICLVLRIEVWSNNARKNIETGKNLLEITCLFRACVTTCSPCHQTFHILSSVSSVFVSHIFLSVFPFPSIVFCWLPHLKFIHLPPSPLFPFSNSLVNSFATTDHSLHQPLLNPWVSNIWFHFFPTFCLFPLTP